MAMHKSLWVGIFLSPSNSCTQSVNTPFCEKDAVKGDDVGVRAARAVAEDFALHHLGQAAAAWDHFYGHVLIKLPVKRKHNLAVHANANVSNLQQV